MRTAQYVRQERIIAAVDGEAIRERWMWGLRLVRDPHAFAPGSSQLRPGWSAAIITATERAGLRLSEREIHYRMRCARAYPTNAQIVGAVARHRYWTDLREANFPAVDVPPDEPLADIRTLAERRNDRARALLEAVGEAGGLFASQRFDDASALKELVDYADQQDDLTNRFVEHGRKRRAYLDALIDAADGDLSVTWQVAHERGLELGTVTGQPGQAS